MVVQAIWNQIFTKPSEHRRKESIKKREAGSCLLLILLSARKKSNQLSKEFVSIIMMQDITAMLT